MIQYEERHKLIGLTPGVGMPTWAEWLTLSGVVLKDRLDMFRTKGVRERAIGHARVFNTQWALTIGMWGVYSLSDIRRSLPVAKTDSSIRCFKHIWYLQTPKTSSPATRPLQVCFDVQEHLINGVGQTEPVMDWKEVGRAAGVLPIEAVLYDMAFQGMMTIADMTPKALMKVSKADREELWKQLGVKIGPESIIPAGGEFAPSVVMAPEQMSLLMRKGTRAA